MKVIDEGHMYEIAGDQQISFLKKDKMDGVFQTIYEGTTNEELLEVLIDRTRHLNSQFPCAENAAALASMADALAAFNSRTAKRVQQNVEGKNENHV